MSFSQKPLVDERKAAFARLASRVLETLNEAVAMRRDQGQTLSAIADRIGCNRSSITRVLNGTSSNLTLRTISDILWATDFDPQDFTADPIESIAPNWCPVDDHSGDVTFRVYDTQVVRHNTLSTMPSSLHSKFKTQIIEFSHQ